MRYAVSEFDKNTFVVVDQNMLKEVCVCSGGNAKAWAEKISNLLENSGSALIIHAQASIEGWTAAKESSEKEITDLRQKLEKVVEALKAVEYVSGLEFWGADPTKERCPRCGTPKGEGHKYDTNCLINQAGVHWFHSWPVFPISQEDGTKKFTLSVDGEDFGELNSTNIYDAVKEAEGKVEEMPKVRNGLAKD